MTAAEMAISHRCSRRASKGGATASCSVWPAVPTSACTRSPRPHGWCPMPPTREANIIFGTVIDDTLGDEVRVTVIAAGFDGGAPLPRLTTPNRLASPKASAQLHLACRAQVDRSVESFGRVGRPLAPATRGLLRDAAGSSKDADDLDVPDFLK